MRQIATPRILDTNSTTWALKPGGLEYHFKNWEKDGIQLSILVEYWIQIIKGRSMSINTNNTSNSITYNFTDYHKSVFNVEIPPITPLTIAGRFCAMTHSNCINKIASVCLKIFFYIALPALAFAIGGCAVLSPILLNGYIGAGILVKLAGAVAAIGLGWISTKFHNEYTIQKQDLIFAQFFGKMNLPVYQHTGPRTFDVCRIKTHPEPQNFTPLTPIQQYWETSYTGRPMYFIKFKEGEKDYISYFCKKSEFMASNLISGNWTCDTFVVENGTVAPLSVNPLWTSSNFSTNFNQLKTLVKTGHLESSQSR
jgi:hypothetical protein